MVACKPEASVNPLIYRESNEMLIMLYKFFHGGM